MFQSVPAFAQASRSWIAGGIGQRGMDFEASGELLGVIVPATPFNNSRSGTGATLSVFGGYDFALGGGLFSGIEAALDVSDIEVLLDPVTSSGTLLQGTDILQCPPPGFSGPCLIFPGPLIALNETQTMVLDVSENVGGSLKVRAGYDFGRTRIWVSAGLAVQGIKVSYALPPLVRTNTPSSTATKLDAENRSEKDALAGSVVGFGIEHSLTERLSMALTYRRGKYGEASFFDTTRVRNLKVGGESEGADLALRWSF